jgi:cytochrome c
LWGILGQHAASRPDFDYSSALKASGIVWSETLLDKWLANPSVLVPGNKMGFGGFADPEDRKSVIEYLKLITVEK